MTHKVARLCWNTNRWQKPSGRVGKSKNTSSFEYINGYGHEEWLFDLEKLFEGYHYGYIQAIRKSIDPSLNQPFDLSLYSINTESSEKYWLGKIEQAEIVEEEESKEVFSYYKKNRWLNQMKAQLKQVGADTAGFTSTTKPEHFSVIKFRPEKLNLLENPLLFTHKDKYVPAYYYTTLLDYTSGPNPPMSIKNKFQFKSGYRPQKLQTIRKHSELAIKPFNTHTNIQNNLYKTLTEKYGKDAVGAELNTGFNTKIDMAVKITKNEYNLYEIKVDSHLDRCVRQALGQLLEYAFQIQPYTVKKMFIVSFFDPKQKIEDYLQTLRSKFRIPVYYMQCLP